MCLNEHHRATIESKLFIGLKRFFVLNRACCFKTEKNSPNLGIFAMHLKTS